MAGARYTRMTVQAASDVPVDTLRADARRAASAAGLVGEVQVQRYPSFLRATVFERHPCPLSVSSECVLNGSGKQDGPANERGDISGGMSIRDTPEWWSTERMHD